MKSSKLIETLSVFQYEEMLKLGSFLDMPYYSGSFPLRDKARALYSYLQKCFPEFNASALEKQTLYTVIYPNELYTPGRIEKVMSSLYKQIEKFILVESTLENSDPFTNMMTLSGFFKKKNLQRLYDIGIANAKKYQSQILSKGQEDLFNDFLLERAIMNYRSAYNLRNSDLNLIKTINSLDVFFLASRLEYSCDLLAQSNFHIRIELDECIKMLSSLKAFFDHKIFAEVPLIKVYAALYELLILPDTDNERVLLKIESLEELLAKFKNKISLKQLKSLHSVNRSLLMKLINWGRKDLNSYGFVLYKEHLDNDMLSSHKGIHAGNFKNIVSIGLVEKKYKWVRGFLSKYKDQITGTDYPEEVYKFNLANYYFHIGEIDKAHEVMGQEYEDLYYKLAAKRLEIKIFYEQNSELLEYKLNAFKQFIHRLSKGKLIDLARNSNNNFINALKQIMSPTNISEAKKERLRNKIQKAEAIKDKDWLLSIIS